MILRDKLILSKRFKGWKSSNKHKRRSISKLKELLRKPSVKDLLRKEKRKRKTSTVQNLTNWLIIIRAQMTSRVNRKRSEIWSKTTSLMPSKRKRRLLQKWDKKEKKRKQSYPRLNRSLRVNTRREFNTNRCKQLNSVQRQRSLKRKNNNSWRISKVLTRKKSKSL